MIPAEKSGLLGASRFGPSSNILEDKPFKFGSDYNSDAKRTTKNFPKAWNKFFEMLYNCKNASDVYIRGLELRCLKKPLMVSPFEYERRWNNSWNNSMTLPPGHRPIPGAIMKLIYFFLGFPKPDRLGSTRYATSGP